jgi:hypothetical protein
MIALAVALVPASTLSAAQAATTPAQVTGLKVVTDPLSPPGEITFTWNASTNPDLVGYAIEGDTDPYEWDGEFSDFVDDESDTTYTIDGLEPGQAVKFTVRAVAADEESGELYGQPRTIIGNTLGDVNEDGTFSDTVGNTFWYEIIWLATTGITTGYEDGTFRPQAPVLREQMAAFLFRFGGNSGYEAPDFSPFKDVPTTHTFYREISWMWDNGLATGYLNPDGTRSFAPSAPVLREQMAAFLYRSGFFYYSHGSEPASFTDVPPTHVFFDAIEFMALAGVTTGYAEPNGTLTFRPSQPVLREQMAAFLYRIVGVQYSDNFGPLSIEGEQFTTTEDAPTS